MPLLAEYAITPDVFDAASHSTDEVCGLHLRTIGQVMMEEGLVRDLRAGEWRALLTNHGRPWHRLAKKLVERLFTQGRLVAFPIALPTVPADDKEWCAEALAGHRWRPMTGGLIVTGPVKAEYRREPLVERIDLLSRARWWGQRSPSVRLDRKLTDYVEHLDPILRCANSLQFIDPHLHPGRDRYREFGKLLARAGHREHAPDIEIHRVEYVGPPHDRSYPNFQSVFRSALAGPLRAAGLQAKVFIWDDFHDRYLLSNLIGILVANGFDTTKKCSDMTTWTRLGQLQRDDIQKEFDPASGRHTLRAKFTLP